jgi:GTP pyrophosphokinase
MKAQNVSFDEVYDKFALRIVYKSNPHEEKFVVGKSILLFDHYRPSPSRLQTGFLHQNLLDMKPITVMGP